MLATPALLESVAGALRDAGVDAYGWVLAWARSLPSLLLVPALGLPGLPLPLRLVFAAVLGVVIAPTLAPSAGAAAMAPPDAAMLAGELARGVPVALGVALGIWGATMAGNLLDELIGTSSGSRAPFDDSAPGGPLGVLLALVAAIAFFELGGPARMLAALTSAPPLGVADVRTMAVALARGIQLAVVLAGPLLALAPFVELLSGLAARSAFPPGQRAALGSLRGLVLFGGAALLLDRFAAGIVLWLDRALPPG
jgi:type III secretory pathway component EscT